jgi:hypothetical protein
MRTLVSFSLAALLVACSTSAAGTPRSAVSPTVSRLPGAGIPASASIIGGCGESSVYRGPIPTWLEVADGHNTPTSLPWVVATPAIAAGFIFTPQLKAGSHPQDPGNKILWVVRTPRAGSDLEITAHPLAASSPIVTESRPADSWPGEIYPDGLDVPIPGCWRLELRWAHSQATVDLDYH